MEQDAKDEKIVSKRWGIGTMVGMFIVVLMVVGFLKWGQLSGEISNYKLGNVAFSFPETKGQYIGINKNQIFRVTKDGVTSYNVKGDEVWTDTLTLDKGVIKQKEPYFAIGNMGDKKISVFSDKGKESDIITQDPIVYFSINKKGDIGIIEETKEGHVISAYTKEGMQIDGKRTTYIQSAGFPISVEVLPGSKMLVASYIDIYSPIVTSVLAGMPLDEREEEKVDNIKFGVEVKNNLVYEIEAVNDNIWAAIGDSRIEYYNTNGELVGSFDNHYLTYPAYVESGIGKMYLPVIGSNVQGSQSIQGEGILYILDESGKEVSKQSVGRVTYFRADDKGIVIGEGKDYKGLNKKGELMFTLHTSQDVEHVGYVGKELVALTKNEVIRLEKISEVK